MSLRAEVGPELVRALEDGTRVRPDRTFSPLTRVCSEAYVRCLAGQVDFGYLRPCGSEGSHTKLHEEARKSRSEISGV
jgi:hypothetical protein